MIWSNIFAQYYVLLNLALWCRKRLEITLKYYKLGNITKHKIITSIVLTVIKLRLHVLYAVFLAPHIFLIYLKH